MLGKKKLKNKKIIRKAKIKINNTWTAKTINIAYDKSYKIDNRNKIAVKGKRW